MKSANKNNQVDNQMITRSSVKRMVRDMIRSVEEVKFFNTTVAATTSLTPTIYALTQPIVQGIGGGQRIGDEILLKEILLRFRLDINQANTALTNVVRFIIFSDNMADGAFPLYTDLLTSTGVTSLYSYQVVKTKRFKIYLDQISGLNLNGEGVKVFSRQLKVHAPVFFNDGTNASTANGKGSLFIMVWTDVSGNFPALNGDIEMRFTDS
jgi:hypothetical protein